MPNMFIDESGNQYGKLLVLGRVERKVNTAWLCKCDCGSETIARGCDLRSGDRVDCGRLTCKNPPTTPAFNPVGDAYFAGHFDGEGCLRFCTNRSKHPYLHATVQVTYKPVLMEYQQEFGGEIYVGSKRVKQLWQWTLSEMNVLLPFLRRIHPFSKEKQPQIALALEYLDCRMLGKRTELPVGLKDRMPELVQQMTAMKRFSYEVEAN